MNMTPAGNNRQPNVRRMNNNQQVNRVNANGMMIQGARRQGLNNNAYRLGGASNANRVRNGQVGRMNGGVSL